MTNMRSIIEKDGRMLGSERAGGVGIDGEEQVLGLRGGLARRNHLAQGQRAADIMDYASAAGPIIRGIDLLIIDLGEQFVDIVWLLFVEVVSKIGVSYVMLWG